MAEGDRLVSELEPLFRPLRVGTLELRNRIGMSPMSRYYAKDGVQSGGMVDYYLRRAKGGVGLIVTEGTHPDHPVSHFNAAAPHLYGEDAAQAWRAIVAAVHGAGARIVPQLWHTGGLRQRAKSANPDVPSVTPSGLVPHGDDPSRAMSDEDIADVIAAFADAAALARTIGFDGVAVHGAHGYLFDAFAWAETNTRRDRYGGDTLRQRMRFSVETVRAIRARVGPDFPIMWRFSQWKLTPLKPHEGYAVRMAQTPHELADLVEPLVDAGVDILDPSTRRFWEPAFEGSPLTLAGWTRKIGGRTTSTVGSIGLENVFSPFVPDGTAASPVSTGRLRLLAGMVDRGEVDLALVGRALLGEPEWANKVKAGDLAGLRPLQQERVRDIEPAELG